MDLLRPAVHAIPPERGDYLHQSVEAEITDLRQELKHLKMPEAEANLICSRHLAQRQKLADFVEAERIWKQSHSDTETDQVSTEPRTQPEPTLTNLEVTDGLPGEFVDYFEGFIAWHNPVIKDKKAARDSWERLLLRPETERRHKSTWAAFMLGRSWEKANPEKAIDYFHQVRDLARHGYRDSLGLAAASLGLEARVCLAQTNYQKAIELYLEQMASGDPTATNSLLAVAERAVNAGPEILGLLAKNAHSRKVITAYLISMPSGHPVYSDSRDYLPAGQSMTQRWLQAVETAGIRDVDSAEALALAAYQANDIETADRWIRRAPDSPVAQWLRAKLLLRAGKLQEAASLLARLSSRFPIIHEGTNAPPAQERKDVLMVGGDSGSGYGISAERQVQGELGVLRLARGEYVQALDSLLNAGFWMDAAYVAERVLSLEELKTYVDRFWPAAPPEQVAQEEEHWGDSDVCPARLREQIRYLLARRMTRGQPNEAARDYYPTAWAASFDALLNEWRAGWDETSPAHDRAMALFRAALMTRTNGMELVGTEVAPDWHIHDGQFDYGVTGEERGTNKLARVLRASADELRRNSEYLPEPDRRYHYRYQAASLAWESARLLPNNTDETAYVLWQGGSFLKHREPQIADYFYKALVRGNRQTALGAEADRQRWFPLIDNSGNILPRRKPVAPDVAPPSTPLDPPGGEKIDLETAAVSAVETDAGAETTTGYEYVLHQGDSLVIIATKCAEAGRSLTVKELLQANPGLDPAKLRVGQRLFIPAAKK